MMSLSIILREMGTVQYHQTVETLVTWNVLLNCPTSLCGQGSLFSGHVILGKLLWQHYCPYLVPLVLLRRTPCIWFLEGTPCLQRPLLHPAPVSDDCNIPSLPRLRAGLRLCIGAPLVPLCKMKTIKQYTEDVSLYCMPRGSLPHN